MLVQHNIYSVFYTSEPNECKEAIPPVVHVRFSFQSHAQNNATEWSDLIFSFLENAEASVLSSGSVDSLENTIDT